MQLPTLPQNQLCNVYIYSFPGFFFVCFCYWFAFILLLLLFISINFTFITIYLVRNSNIAFLQIGINSLVFYGYAGIMLASPV